MTARAKPYLLGLAAGIAIQIAGRVLDGIWHANHDEFEGASQQLQAHWLLWLGVLFTLAVCALAIGRLPAGERSIGYPITLAGCAFYVPIAIWHFIEHSNLNDPDLAHYLLAIGQITIFVGAAIAIVSGIRSLRDGRSRGLPPA